MGPIELTIRLLAGVGVILGTAHFVAIEFALTRARQYDESEFDESGLRRASAMTDVLEDPLDQGRIEAVDPDDE